MINAAPLIDDDDDEMLMSRDGAAQLVQEATGADHDDLQLETCVSHNISLLAASSESADASSHEASLKPSARKQAAASWSKRLPYYIPVLRWAPAYSVDNLLTDALAGLTVGIINVGSAIVNAGVAKRPINNGLLTAIFPTMFYCLFGSSMYDSEPKQSCVTERHFQVIQFGFHLVLFGRQMQFTTELVISLLFQQNFFKIMKDSGIDLETIDLTKPSAEVNNIAQVTAMLTALCLLFMGVFRLGFLETVLAHSVIVGMCQEHPVCTIATRLS